MKKAVRVFAGVAVAVCMVMTAGSALAAENGPKFKIGVGTYDMIIAGDCTSDNSDDREDAHFNGGAFVGTACLTKNVAVRGAFYATDYKDDSNLEMNGLDVQLLLGSNFYEGWNAFGGVGYFSETLEYDGSSFEKDFRGGELCFGVGYSWSRVTLDYVATVRDTSDYEDYFHVDHDFAVSGGITLSYIF